jgi:hypothetical protein
MQSGTSLGGILLQPLSKLIQLINAVYSTFLGQTTSNYWLILNGIFLAIEPHISLTL